MATSNKPEVFETLFAETTAGFFLREFSFSSSTFTPPKGSEVEFADFVVHLDDLLMVFQLKTRSSPSTDPEDERSWFQRKVIKKATQQIRDTIKYLQECPPEIPNDQPWVHNPDMEDCLREHPLSTVCEARVPRYRVLDQ